MMSLDLQRALHRVLGIHPKDMQRVIIDIQNEGPPIIYVSVVAKSDALESVIDAIRLEHPDIRKVDILEAPEVSTEEFVGGTSFGTLVINPDGCTNSVPCPIKELHGHRSS